MSVTVAPPASSRLRSAALLLALACTTLGCAGHRPTHPAAAAPPVRLLADTSEGPILIEVDPARAPLTAAHFLRNVDAKVYDGGSFYRTVRADNDHNPATINVIQGGMSRPDQPGGPTPPFAPIAHESTRSSGLRHEDGAVSMARLAPGTANTEFFISIGENPVLDAGGTRNPDLQGFAVFGRVVDGMALIRRIHAAPANAPTGDAYVKGQMLDAPVIIRSIGRVK